MGESGVEDKPKRRQWERRDLQSEGEFEYFDHTGYRGGYWGLSLSGNCWPFFILRGAPMGHDSFVAIFHLAFR